MLVAGNLRFRGYVKNVEPEAITEGRQEYALLGADPISKKIRVDKKNIFGRVYLYSQISNAKWEHRQRFEKMLLQMLRSGRYFADAAWCLSPYGHYGMERSKAAAAFRLYTRPQQFTEADMMCLFFAANDRWSARRYEDEVMTEDINLPTPAEEQEYLRRTQESADTPMNTLVDVCLHAASVEDKLKTHR